MNKSDKKASDKYILDRSLSNRIEVSNICKSYTSNHGVNTEILNSITFEIGQSEFVSIVGPSGCGKTTLLKIISGLIKPDSGKVTIGGDSPLKSRGSKSIGYVFQDPALIPWRTVYENIRLPIEVNKQADDTNSRNIEELISLVGLDGFSKHYPHQLSGGMRQRVSLARALSINPKLLIMDEPFGALDEITRESMRYELLDLWTKTKPTILFVTHNSAEAVFLSDRIIVMPKAGAGKTTNITVSLERPRTENTESEEMFNQLINQVRRSYKC
ncbi:MAG: NitT/TauT family transport system ATP-binding protein [Chloroflexi bacterium]|nr:MAG: NitT/TauT family transport system ATP-binding protein [Chloroflexota bacterium]